MNLFDFDNSNRGLSISTQFWIFPVIAIPLTALTLGTWYWLTKRRLRQIKKRDQDQGKAMVEYGVMGERKEALAV